MSKRSNHPTNERPSARFAYDGLDRVFHEKARLGILTSLLTQPQGLSFSDLKELCGLSDGNLNRHLSVLQDAGFVKSIREGGGRNSLTVCRITRPGQVAFAQYLRELERVLADAAKIQNQPVRSLRTGWSAP